MASIHRDTMVTKLRLTEKHIKHYPLKPVTTPKLWFTRAADISSLHHVIEEFVMEHYPLVTPTGTHPQ